MTHSIYQCFVFLIAQKEKNSRYLWSCTEWLLADSWICIRGSKGGGAREVTSPVEILSISCSFWEHLAKLCICAPLPLPWGVGAPTSWKSWIRHWFVHKYVVVCFFSGEPRTECFGPILLITFGPFIRLNGRRTHNLHDKSVLQYKILSVQISVLG